MDTIRTFNSGNSRTGRLYSLPALAAQGFEKVNRLPVSLRIVLESLMRNCDGLKVREEDIRNLASWSAAQPGDFEIPFIVARIVLQDFTGVPLLVDLAAMRSCVDELGRDPSLIEPLVPVDLVVDHSVQLDMTGSGMALNWNLEKEFTRNAERYEFLKWGQQAFSTFNVVPPSVGIVHQVNLEYLTPGIQKKDDMYYPDTLVGTDSHTTMINGLGIVAWGVGGIEAEAGMLGQPVTFLVPRVTGVNLQGRLRPGVLATDLALHVTQILRQKGVVGHFVEFFGEGASSLSLPDRATVANMAPEYGATIGFFPMDGKCSDYLRHTGRDEEKVQEFENYYMAQEMWGMPREGEIDYSDVLTIDLDDIEPCVSGPRKPQERIPLPSLGNVFGELLCKSPGEGGYGRPPEDVRQSCPVILSCPAGHDAGSGEKEGFIPSRVEVRDGSVLIASITSCTNTSHPGVMLAAGLLARNAIEKGLSVPAFVKTSLAPGSRVVTDYLEAAGLDSALDQLGFHTVAYGCSTCIGNSGPLQPAIESAVRSNGIIGAAVLSGNRNFEARIHPSVKANFLMSPPLVIAFALAGRVDIDMEKEPIGTGSDGSPIYLKDIWPGTEEIEQALEHAVKAEYFTKRYSSMESATELWKEVPSPSGALYPWNDSSTYIQNPPFCSTYTGRQCHLNDITGARPLGIFGDGVTTDHISPAGSIRETGPAGIYLKEHGVAPMDFNSFGSRRGNDKVMTRGTFANVRIKNLMLPGSEGGYTLYFGDRNVSPPDKELSSEYGQPTFIYDAARAYGKDCVPLIVIGGDDYGMGSSRDWAAKGTALLGVKAVIVKSFERIHRSNLIGMGILPLTFANPIDYERVSGLKDAVFSITGLSDDMQPGSPAVLKVEPAGEKVFEIPLIVRLDTAMEKEYYLAGGILPYVMGQILAGRA